MRHTWFLIGYNLPKQQLFVVKCTLNKINIARYRCKINDVCLFRKPPIGRFRPIKAGTLPSMKDMKADNKDLANRMAEIKNISTEFQNDLFNKFNEIYDALVQNSTSISYLSFITMGIFFFKKAVLCSSSSSFSALLSRTHNKLTSSLVCSSSNQ